LEATLGTVAHEFKFYTAYARLARFGVKKNRKRGKDAQEFCCTKEGKHKAVDEAERVTSKTSKRGRCRQWSWLNYLKTNHMPFLQGFCWTTIIS
jgi:hypothetical protein